MNFENLIRLLYISINNTLSSNLALFSSYGNDHYFYFIFHNYQVFTNQTQLNYYNC